jgi:hypothetical protein
MRKNGKPEPPRTIDANGTNLSLSMMDRALNGLGWHEDTRVYVSTERWPQLVALYGGYILERIRKQPELAPYSLVVCRGYSPKDPIDMPPVEKIECIVSNIGNLASEDPRTHESAEPDARKVTDVTEDSLGPVGPDISIDGVKVVVNRMLDTATIQVSADVWERMVKRGAAC